MRHGDGAGERASPANVQAREKEPRMPAILEDEAWSTWLGEDNAPPTAAKAVLKTMNGVKW